jgi:hypothetical protein
VRKEQDRLRGVADRLLGQARLVVLDERHDVSARDIPVIRDGEARSFEVEPDGSDFTAWDC